MGLQSKLLDKISFSNQTGKKGEILFCQKSGVIKYSQILYSGDTIGKTSSNKVKSISGFIDLDSNRPCEIQCNHPF
jgi:hypothetical protein